MESKWYLYNKIKNIELSRECRQNVFDPDHNDDDGGEGGGDEFLRNFVERNIVDKVEMWSIRAFMVIASAMPLFAVIAALCGNRFCGYVQMVVAGFFGFFGVWTFVIYCAHKVSLLARVSRSNKLIKVNLSANDYNKLADPLQLGITFYLACVGVGIIWMMTLLECLICSQKYRETVHYHSPATVAPSHTTDSHSETSSIVSVQTDMQQTNKYAIE